MSKTRRLCEDCGASYFNFHSHLEECPGVVGFETVEFQCGRCLRTSDRSEWCHGMWMSRVNAGAYRAPRPRPL